MNKLKRAGSDCVTGDKFWNRQKEIELFIEYLEEGAHVLFGGLTSNRKNQLNEGSCLAFGETFLLFAR